MTRNEFADFIEKCTSGFTSVISEDYKKNDFAHIDLSEVSKELKGVEIPSANAIKKAIDEFLKSKKSKVAYGGYNEKRNLYKESVIFNDDKTVSPRNIHIGLDLWCETGTAVLTPLDGTIHSFQDNEGFGNYGPTIIVEHSYAEKTFFTLYGHLSRQSLKNLAFGQIVEAGDKIGILGSPKVNGNYAPHLHFQIISDLQGNAGDYPGVVAKEDLDRYLENCPDPNLLLKIK